MWVVCKFEAGGGSQMDRLPNKFYDITFHDDEVAALRHANATRGKAVELRAGATLDDLYFGRER